MHPDSEDRLALGFGQPIGRRRLAARRDRCAKAAGALFAAGVSMASFLSLWGLQPPRLAVPAFVAAASLLFASASAALFARVAHLQLLDADFGEDEDDHGPGGGYGEPPDPPGGGDLEVDWARFERQFRAYCERASAVEV